MEDAVGTSVDASGSVRKAQLEEQTDHAVAMNVLARLHDSRGEHEKAEDLYRRALTMVLDRLQRLEEEGKA